MHRHIFQDLPHHKPGEFRPDAPGHVKVRTLETTAFKYEVGYLRGAEAPARVTEFLKSRNLVDELKTKDKTAFSERLATIYQELDTGHLFSEGNSRTLREFTREMAAAAGWKVDWEKIGDKPAGRDLLYLARDVGVFTRMYPGIDRPGFEPKDRTALEAQNIVSQSGSSIPTLAKLIAGVSREMERGPERNHDLGQDR